MTHPTLADSLEAGAVEQIAYLIGQNIAAGDSRMALENLAVLTFYTRLGRKPETFGELQGACAHYRAHSTDGENSRG